MSSENENLFPLPLHEIDVTECVHFVLDDDQWQAFNAALDAQTSVNPALMRLLATPAPWEE